MTHRKFSHSIHVFYNLLKQSAHAWSDDNAPRMGAALAFYTIFSLAPSLIIAIGFMSLLFGQSFTEGQISFQMNHLMGTDSAQSIMSLIQTTRRSTHSWGMALFEMGTLIVASTSALVELKNGLNYVWRVHENENVESFFKRRFMSLAFIGGLTFMLLVALGVRLLLSIAGISLQNGPLTLTQKIVGEVFSFGVMLLFFATVYKVLPDRSKHWKDLWAGSALSAFFFTVGKVLVGLYIVKTAVKSEYGAAGSFVAVLLWVYVSALILYFGAEFIKVRGRHKNR